MRARVSLPAVDKSSLLSLPLFPHLAHYFEYGLYHQRSFMSRRGCRIQSKPPLPQPPNPATIGSASPAHLPANSVCLFPVALYACHDKEGKNNIIIVTTYSAGITWSEKNTWLSIHCLLLLLDALPCACLFCRRYLKYSHHVRSERNQRDPYVIQSSYFQVSSDFCPFQFPLQSRLATQHTRL